MRLRAVYERKGKRERERERERGEEREGVESEFFRSFLSLSLVLCLHEKSNCFIGRSEGVFLVFVFDFRNEALSGSQFFFTFGKLNGDVRGGDGHRKDFLLFVVIKFGFVIASLTPTTKYPRKIEFPKWAIAKSLFHSQTWNGL